MKGESQRSNVDNDVGIVWLCARYSAKKSALVTGNWVLVTTVLDFPSTVIRVWQETRWMGITPLRCRRVAARVQESLTKTHSDTSALFRSPCCSFFSHFLDDSRRRAVLRGLVNGAPLIASSTGQVDRVYSASGYRFCKAALFPRDRTAWQGVTTPDRRELAHVATEDDVESIK